MLLTPGSQLSQNTKIAETNTALAKSGIEVVTIDRNDTSRSTAGPWRIPARMPRVNATGTITANARPARVKVCARFGSSRSITGSRKCTEVQIGRAHV